MKDTRGGVLIVNKPFGMTSHDVVNKIRRLYNTKKVGHTGTLDPMATGVLPVLVGGAVKASEYLMSDSKAYSAAMRLGITTDTEDTSGKILSECDDIPSDGEIEEAILSFVGEYLQIPPMYSALKVNGEKLCDLARRGIEVEREPRPVTVYSLSCKKLSEREWEIDTVVSKGTYIRTLIADIGKRLSCGAAMSALERRISGSFTLASSHTLEELETLGEVEREGLLISVEELFSDCKCVTLPEFYERLAKNGAEIYPSRARLGIELEVGEKIRMCDSSGGFFALGEVRSYPSGIAVKPIKFF